MDDAAPRERELKLAVGDLAAVEQRLRTLGAALQGIEQETNEVLDTTDGLLAHRLQRLRLRTVAGKPGVRVTWKGPASQDQGLKSREEQEYQADDPATCAIVFARLGYHTILTYRKERATWLWQGLSITLDRLEFGSFVEIEAPLHAPSGPPEALIAECLRTLGLRNAPRVEVSYAVLQERWDAERPQQRPTPAEVAG